MIIKPCLNTIMPLKNFMEFKENGFGRLNGNRTKSQRKMIGFWELAHISSTHQRNKEWGNHHCSPQGQDVVLEPQSYSLRCFYIQKVRYHSKNEPIINWRIKIEEKIKKERTPWRIWVDTVLKALNLVHWWMANLFWLWSCHGCNTNTHFTRITTTLLKNTSPSQSCINWMQWNWNERMEEIDRRRDKAEEGITVTQKVERQRKKAKDEGSKRERIVEK